jgi:hypothetical protein
MIPREILRKIQHGETRPNHRVLRPRLPAPLRADHFRRCESRSFNSALTRSHGIPRSGCFTNSSARRSISSICSGVGSGSYPFSWMLPQTRCASSMRSARLNFESISIFRVFQAKKPLGMGGAFQPWKPSVNSSQRQCASSTRSSNGSFFAAAKNFDNDMDSIYSIGTRVQAPFLACGISSFCLHPSSFPLHDPARNP